MPTTFIALQCFQCSTMQVKQQKKSSNKWTCVVCNEKQSVRKVFTQASMARDVRNFVQTFNMSRQLADQEEDRRYQTLDPPPDPVEHQPLSSRKKRNDWSEYIDPPEDDKHELQIEEDEFEPKIVTELPKAVFKKPKLNTSTTFSSKDGERGLRPVFSRRKQNDQSFVAQDIEPRKTQPSRNTAFKWSDYAAPESQEGIYTDKGKTTDVFKWRSRGEQDTTTEDIVTVPPRSHIERGRETSSLSNGYRVPTWQCQASKKKGASKWDDYITEDDDADDDLQPKTGREYGADQTAEWGDDFYSMMLHGERVEDDIHPDFQ